MNLKQLKNIHGIENIYEICGKGELGAAMVWLIKYAEEMDAELDIIHNAITELYNIEGNQKIIKTSLAKITKLSR